MTQEPISELAPLCHLIQEIRQSVGLVKSPAQFVLHRSRSTVGDDVVHLPVVPLQAGFGGPLLFLAGQLLFPPEMMIHSIKRSALIEPPAFLLKLRIVRFQNAAADVMATGAAHREEGLVLYIVNLSSQQVNHRRANPLYCAAMPFFYREPSQHIKVLMVAGYEHGGEGFCL